MGDAEDRLRELLESRAARVHSHLSGPRIRARAQRRDRTRWYAPLLAAAAVVVVAAIGLVFLNAESPPSGITPATTTTVPVTRDTAPLTSPTSPTTAHRTPAPSTGRSRSSCNKPVRCRMEGV